MWLVSSLLVTAHAVATHAEVFVVLGAVQLVSTAIILVFGTRYHGSFCPLHRPCPPELSAGARSAGHRLGADPRACSDTVEPFVARESTGRRARRPSDDRGVSVSRNLAQKLIASHLVEGDMVPGSEIGIRIDQTLTQDATGTMVMLELEAMRLDRVRTELSAQYVDHNLLQADFRNADDHLFLRSACQRFGLWYSKPGNGVSHPVHMQRFGVPGKTLLGSDSHTCAAGSLGMLAIGAGGLEVAMAMAGEPFHLTMPADLGRAVGRRAPGLGEREGRHPRDAAPPRREGRARTHHRVLRARDSQTSRRWTAT